MHHKIPFGEREEKPFMFTVHTFFLVGIKKILLMSQGRAVAIEQRKSNCEKYLEWEEKSQEEGRGTTTILSATLYSWACRNLTGPWFSFLSSEGLSSVLGLYSSLVREAPYLWILVSALLCVPWGHTCKTGLSTREPTLIVFSHVLGSE